MRIVAWLFAAMLVLGAGAAQAAYPVAGAWTYDNASRQGAAATCGPRRTEFAGNRRFDSAGGAPDYRNVSVRQTGAAQYRVVDEFFTGMMRGRVHYTLRLIDADHIEIKLDAGARYLLRRCG